MNTPATTTPTSELQADGLLPCPFCGSNARLLGYRYKDGKPDDVRCTNSVCTLRSWSTPVEEWNTRTPPPQEAPAAVMAVGEIDYVPHLAEIAKILAERGFHPAAMTIREVSKLLNTRRVASGEVMVNGVLVEEIAEMLDSYRYAISDCNPKLDVRIERFHYIPRIDEIIASLRAGLPSNPFAWHTCEENAECVACDKPDTAVCHCTCHNDPLYCRECKECDCHAS